MKRLIVAMLGFWVGACSSVDRVQTESAAEPSPDIVNAVSQDPERRRLLGVLKEAPNDQEANDQLAELEGAEDVAFGLIARRENDSGHLVKFFEPKPGRLVIIQRYYQGSVPENRPSTISELWEDVAKGEEMPPALKALDDNQKEALKQRLADGGPEVREPEVPFTFENEPERAHLSGDFAAPSKTLAHVVGDGDHFMDDQLGCSVDNTADIDVSWCWLERSGGWFVWRDPAEGMATALAMFSGNVMTWRVTVDGATSNTTIRPNEIWSVNTCIVYCTPWCWELDTDYGISLLDAEAYVDMWHWGGAIYEDIDMGIWNVWHLGN